MPYAVAGELGHSRAQTPSLPTHRVSPGYERIIAEAPESVNRYSKKPQIGGNLCYIRWQKIPNRSMFPRDIDAVPVGDPHDASVCYYPVTRAATIRTINCGVGAKILILRIANPLYLPYLHEGRLLQRPSCGDLCCPGVYKTGLAVYNSCGGKAGPPQQPGMLPGDSVESRFHAGLCCSA